MLTDIQLLLVQVGSVDPVLQSCLEFLQRSHGENLPDLRHDASLTFHLNTVLVV